MGNATGSNEKLEALRKREGRTKGGNRGGESQTAKEK
jgi:hypothetical protein